MGRKTSGTDSNGDPKRQEDLFPPKLSWKEKLILAISYFLAFFAFLYIADQLCFPKITPPCVCCTYIAFGFVLAAFIVDRLIRHELIVHKARREDISEVEALFVEARNVEPTQNGPMKNSEYFSKKKAELLAEVARLKEVGNRGWSEYQVLALNQMLIEFLEKEELIARAQSSLEDLEDYASDKAYGGYDQRQYDNWKVRIDGAIKKLEEGRGKSDDQYAALQAKLETLLEHVASYNANWSEGSAILRGIRMCGVVALFLLFPMSLLPFLHPVNITNSDQALGCLNWGLLGVIGAITAVLLNLSKSDYVEVGNTEGKKELWRAFGGTGLGFVAGILAYWTIAGGLFTGGSAVPELGASSLRDIGLSVLWAVAAGYCFENVLDRTLTMTPGANQ
ncbi:MAG: hypothetical protein ABIN18_24405 [Pseudomonadota bacterium]